MKRLTKRPRDADVAQQERERIHDPPVPNPKGRPRTARMTGPTEGRSRGGGAGNGSGRERATNRCSRCHQMGHNRTTCPQNQAR